MAKAKKNKSIKRLALWLDHAHAHFLELKKDRVVIQTVYSEQETRVRFPGETSDTVRVSNQHSNSREKHKQNRLKNQRVDYYKSLARVMESYTQIYLFGPTTAKKELLNWIREHQHIEDKTIIVDQSPEIPLNQIVNRVREIFGAEAPPRGYTAQRQGKKLQLV